MTRRRQIQWWIGLGLAAAVLLWLLADALLPFVIAFAIAFMLDPVADRLQARGFSRTLATSLVLFGFLLLAIGFLLLVAPMIVAQAGEFLRRAPFYLDQFRENVLPAIERWRAHLGLDDTNALTAIDATRQHADAFAQWLAGLATGLLSSSIAFIQIMATVILTPVVAFYLLRDWDVMLDKVNSWLPPRYAPTIRELALESNRTIAGYVRGQALVCLSLGAFYAVALMIVGLDFGLVIGLVAGVISFIPFVGTIVGGILAIGTALAQFPPDWLRFSVVVAIFVVGQLAEGHVLAPKLVGSRVNLHAVWVMRWWRAACCSALPVCCWRCRWRR